MPLSTAVRQNVLPYWRAFVTDAISGTTLTAVARRYRTLAGKGLNHPPSSRDDSIVGFIRNLVKTGRGGPRTIWTLAAAARGAGLPWFAGPLALFAAGYYADFVHVMATAAYLGQALPPSQRVLDRQRLLDLVLAVEGATLPSEPSEREIEARAVYDQRIRRGDSKRRIGSARNRLAEAEKERRDAWRAGREPAERTVWRCSPAEHAIFDAARLQATNPFAGNSLVVAATLADAHPEIGLQAQQGVVVHALEAWLSL